MSKERKGTRLTSCQARQLIILVVLAISAFLLTSCGFKNLPAEQVLNKALLNTVTAKSYQAQLSVKNAELPALIARENDALKKISKIKITLQNDQRKKNNSVTALLLEIFSGNLAEPIARLNLFSDGTNLFFNIERLPKLSRLKLKSLLDQTYRINLADLKGLLPARFIGPLAPVENIDPKILAGSINNNPYLFKDIKELDATAYNGEPTRRFLTKLDESSLKNIANDLVKTTADNQDKINMDEERKLPDNLADKTLEVWVGLNSKRIVRVKSAEHFKKGFGFDLLLGNFDKDLGLAAPADTQELNLLELMSKLGSGIKIPSVVNGTSNGGASNEASGGTRNSSDQIDSSINNLDIGDSTWPGLPDVPFPVQ